MAGRIAAGGLALALVTISCGPSPGTPSAPASILSVPTPLAPTDAALVLTSARGAVSLTVRNAVSRDTKPILLSIDVAQFPNFGSTPGWAATVPQADGDTTSVPIALPSIPASGRARYYWRVHATAGEAVSGYSGTAMFVLGADSANPVVAPDPPTLLSPVAGSSIGQRNARVLLAAPTSTPNLIGYVVQISTTATFSQNVQTCVAPSLSGTNAAYCLISLSPGSYFYRAQSVAGVGSSISSGLHGAFSPAVPFAVIDEILDVPRILSQGFGAPATNPVRISVQNIARTAPVGPIGYAFTLVAGDSGLPYPTVATATVPEDSSGVTTWTLAVEVPVNQRYSVLVHAIDTVNGVAGDDTLGQVTVVPASSVALTMELDLPRLGVPCHSKITFPVTASHDLAGSVAITSGFGLTMDLVEIGQSVSGTIHGRVEAGEGDYLIDGNAKPQGAVSGTITDRSHASGTFAGRVSLINNVLENITCSTAGASWSLVPR